MNVLIYFIIAILYVILLSWTWNNTKSFGTVFNQIVFIALGIIVLIIVTYITFNISKIGVNYQNKEIANQIRRISMLIFIPLNGFISIPHIANIKSEIELKNEEQVKIKQKIITLGVIFIIALIIEIMYLRDFQNGIIQILNNK